MSGKMTDVKIKMEGNDLQTYLESFNKEIEGGETIAIVQQDDSDEEEEEGGSYFIDETGNYYFQASKDVAPVLTSPPEDGEEFVTDEIEHLESDEAPSKSASPTNDEDYQPVQLVQSENNPGVSYVLIMEDNENKDPDDEQNSRVYEFDENEEENDKKFNMDSGAEDDKSKIVKIPPKKSQLISQAHMCNYCNYTSPKRYLLSRHMKSHSEERPHKCSVCERGFKTLASLNNHVNTHTGTKPHSCKFCESAFTTSGELVRHVRYRHTHEKPHKCTECDYASVELSKLKRHIRCHTGERPYQCPHCTYASPDTFKLKRHLRIHTGEKPYECDVCHARFTQSNSLKAHKLIHSVGDKPVFHCELCPTTCGRKTDLRIHVQKLHISDKPLKCRRCGKSFPDRYSYKIHSKTHEGEKCYKCELCPYASISARHLESHLLIHTDQKPYQCSQCDQSFRQKQLLKRHINLYHNPAYVPPVPKEKTHGCPNCSRVFRHKGNLIRHMAIHDPESNTRDTAIALKLGRQKRITMMNGENVSGIDTESEPELEENDEIDTENGHVMQVEGEDGQQYVVLEVIQIQEDGQQEGDANIEQEEDPMEVEDDFLLPEDIEDEVLNSYRGRKLKADPDKICSSDKDMSNCFGFDDEDDEQNELNEADDEDDERNYKSTIKLLDIE